MNSLSKAWVPVLLILSILLVACNPASEPNTASISGGVFFDCNKDGECEEEDAGIANMCVRLYSGGCGEDMIQMHSTNEDGEFRFAELAAGEYCVIADFELLTCGYAGNHPTTSISRRVTLENGMHSELEWFGFGDLSGKAVPSVETTD
jgi:hypothetical protein